MCNVLQVMLGSLGKKGREGQKVGPEVFERQGELVFRCNVTHHSRQLGYEGEREGQKVGPEVVDWQGEHKAS